MSTSFIQEGDMPTVANPPLVNLTPAEESVRDFRKDMLLNAGFNLENANTLACHFDADWHTAVDMLKNGCDQALVLYILGAVDERPMVPLNN